MHLCSNRQPNSDCKGPTNSARSLILPKTGANNLRRHVLLASRRRTTERYQVDNTSDLAALSVVISGAAEAMGEHAFLMFDSLSALPAYNTEELCTRFVKSHLARMKKHGNVGIYNVEQGIHKESFYNEIRASFDTVIEMKLLETEDDITRMIRVYSHRGTHTSKWFKFLITPERTIKIT